MTTNRLQIMTAVAAFATLFYAGCGDDDSNVSPGSGGSATVSGGKTGSSGGASGTSGGATGTSGGKAGTSGGSTTTTNGGTTASGGETASGGSGGEPVTPQGGSGPIAEGGSGGEGGSGPVGPAPCTTANYDATNECFADCAPNTSTASEQFLNRCGAAGVQCTKFTAVLSKLGTNGALPPLP
ncbi:MAG: hypothetical protein QM756_40255 [Polyangiaceae bacterium]